MVAGCNVQPEELHGVAGQWVLADDHSVPLKKSVGLVARQEELEECGVEMYSVSFGHFARVPKSNVVGKRQFAKSHQREESDAELGAEEEIIM
jgi:hypothetical protein